MEKFLKDAGNSNFCFHEKLVKDFEKWKADLKENEGFEGVYVFKSKRYHVRKESYETKNNFPIFLHFDIVNRRTVRRTNERTKNCG